jgi:SAM-dependent methyltransferase
MYLHGTSVRLTCLSCNSSLTVESDKAVCTQCSSSWPVYSGIPHFINTDTFWGEPGFTREVLQEINNQMLRSYWKDLLRNHDLPEIRKVFAFIEDLDRAKWHSLINLNKDAIVLDIGCGMGTISQALSKHYRTIYSIEPVKERIEFSAKRFTQEQCHNIIPIRSDIDHLPFSEGAFDLIILNGVLEWLPFNRKYENPRKAQLHYLKLLKKLLKKDGYIYIGIENRHNYNYFLGAPDPHILINYVTILPRIISHVLCKLKTGDIYRPYLYSHKGYKKLLSDAGFKNIEIYSAIPSYNDPQYTLNIKEHSYMFKDFILTSDRKIAQFVKKLLIYFDTLKYFGYAYILLAKNDY